MSGEECPPKLTWSISASSARSKRSSSKESHMSYVYMGDSGGVKNPDELTESNIRKSVIQWWVFERNCWFNWFT